MNTTREYRLMDFETIGLIVELFTIGVLAPFCCISIITIASGLATIFAGMVGHFRRFLANIG